MSSIQRRKFKSVTTYRVQVRRLGFKSLSKSFATLTEAKKWCRTMEAKFDREDAPDYSEASKVTMGDLFNLNMLSLHFLYSK